MATFGDRYKHLMTSGSNQKSLFNNNPGSTQGVNETTNPYKNLIALSPTKKSLFSNNPGIEFGISKTKNPYVNLIDKWDFTQVAPEAPFIGRDIIVPIIDVYYVLDGYVDNDYVEVQQAPAW